MTSSEPTIAGPPPRRIPALDGIRGLAILTVLAHNVDYIQFQEPPTSLALKAVRHLLWPGWVGVDLFFALSGFLITGILLESPGQGALVTFWSRRALRIFPLYFTVLMVSIHVIPRVVPKLYSLSEFHGLGWYWVYLSNWTAPWGGDVPGFRHFWSLAVEEQFYLVWPFVVLSLKPRMLVRTCVGLAALSAVVRVGMLVADVPARVIYENTFARMGTLVLGGAASVLVRRPGASRALLPHVRRVVVGSGFALLALAPITGGLDSLSGWMQTVGYSIVSLLCVSLVMDTVLDPGGAFARWMTASWLRWLGKYSYAIYVFHYPIKMALAGPFANALNDRSGLRPLVALLALLCTVLLTSATLALISWNVLERWALTVKDRIAPRRDVATTPAVPSLAPERR